MTGLIEEILTRRYGLPQVQRNVHLERWLWRPDDEWRRSELLKAIGEAPTPDLPPGLRRVYGDALGGSLVRDSLKLATGGGLDEYGLYRLEDLWQLEPIMTALARDPGIMFFMDAANVWYYGVRGPDLWVYDRETDELDNEGPIAEALEERIAEWEVARTAPEASG